VSSKTRSKLTLLFCDVAGVRGGYIEYRSGGVDTSVDPFVCVEGFGGAMIKGKVLNDLMAFYFRTTTE
jgi:hypothetical protein